MKKLLLVLVAISVLCVPAFASHHNHHHHHSSHHHAHHTHAE
ncbi:MAG: hypothetical protein WA655_16235 [Candidatus Korobacteraceae bacterium]